MPLVMSIPGQSPAVIDYATSHLDVVPTLMPTLGINVPASQYSLGCPLSSNHDRLVVVSSWNDIGIITANAKVVVPFGDTTQHANLITSMDDKPMLHSTWANCCRASDGLWRGPTASPPAVRPTPEWLRLY